MNISIIIVTKNRANVLRNCLSLLVSQVSNNDEIIVVDNNSTDGTKAVVKAFMRNYPVQYVIEKRVGASVSRNTGFSMATKEGVAFIDDDSFVADSWLAHIKRTLTNYTFHRGMVVFQGKMIQRYANAGVYEKLRRMEFYNNMASLGMHNHKKLYTNIATLVVANIFARRNILTRVRGPFNAEEFPFIGEDVDISMRLIQQGIQLRYVPDVSVVHAKSQMNLRSTCRASFLYGRSKALHEKRYLHDAGLMFQTYMNSLAIPHHTDKPASYFGLDHSLSTLLQTRWYYWWVSLNYRMGYFIYRYIPSRMVDTFVIGT